MLAGHPGPRLIMLTFAPSPVDADLASALDQLPFDLLILDRKLNVTHANEGAVRSSGIVTGGILGRSALTLAPTNALPQEVYFRALEGCHYHDDSVEIASPPAPVRFFEMDVRPWEDATGVVVGLVILSTAVSERRMLTSLQGASEHRLRMLTENAGDIISVAAADGRLQYVSGGVRNTLGFTAEERHLTSIFEHAHPDDAGAVRAKFQQLVAGEIDRFSHQYRVRHKDGDYRWLDTVYVSALEDPLINGVVINSPDITERKQAESRLAQREEVFRLAADAVDGVIFEWDVARGFVHRSRGVFEILGLEPDELAPAIDAWSDRIHPLRFSDVQEADRSCVDRGPRLEQHLSHSRCPRAGIGRCWSADLIQRNATGDPVRGDRLQRRCVRNQTADRSARGNAAHGPDGRLGIQLCDARAHLDRRDVSDLRDLGRGIRRSRGIPCSRQCTPESKQRVQDGWKRAESTDGQIGSRARNHDAQEPANLDPRDRASGEARRPSVPRLRLGAEHPGAKARANCAREQHGLAQTIDEYGAHACMALGQGERCVRVRHRGWPNEAFTERVSRHEGADGASASEGPAGGESRHRECLPASQRCAARVSAEGQRRPLSIVRDDRAAAIRCGRRAARPRRRHPGCHAHGGSPRRSCAAPNSCCAPRPPTPRIC